MLHKHKNELYRNCTRAINIHVCNFVRNFILDLLGFTSLDEEWENGTIFVQDMHVDVVTNSVPSNYDEVHLGNQMATVFNDAFQACDAVVDESMSEARDLNRQDVFNFHDNEDIEGENVEEVYETCQVNVPKIELDDPHYLKLAT